MTVIKRLNVNTFTTEEDNDAFIAALTELWNNWSGPTSLSKISVDINKDRDNPLRMTAFVTIEGEDAMVAVNEWSKSVVLPIRNKFKHENLMIDADLVATVEK
ncbi:MAG: hypothetical protein EBY35_06645 [Rhodobacteraceae bacterium]|jgi:hypothetical protein|nr:hypothetical protein [Paracoccaceae bacterium]NDH25882.1 hypothetical protein [Paracoccaceae bacterium]